jgi:hypothetical protein
LILADFIFVFGNWGYQQIKVKQDATAVLALATTALGFIGGLFAPSPVK